MAYRRRDAGVAKKLLGVAHLDGRVEVRSHDQYEDETEDLARSIQSQVPPSLRGTIHVSAAGAFETFECMKASIELGLPGQVSPSAVQWAQAEVMRYGTDRVTYHYERSGVVL